MGSSCGSVCGTKVQPAISMPRRIHNTESFSMGQKYNIGEFLLPNQNLTKGQILQWNKISVNNDTSSFNSNSKEFQSYFSNEKHYVCYYEDFPSRFLTAIKFGIPYYLRKSVYKVILFTKRYSISTYSSLLDQESPCEHDINKDIERTFPNELFFKENSQKLKNVLVAISVYFPEVGYIQGINFIVGFLLMINGGNEEISFWEFIYFCENSKFCLKKMYSDDFSLNKALCIDFMKILKVKKPEVCEHFEKSLIPDQCWIFKWFLTLFLSSFKKEIVILFWDFLIVEGTIALLQISLGIVFELENKILSMEYEEIMSFFSKEIDINLNCLKIAKKINLDSFELEYKNI